ncbi:hypothetical protein PENTCL1PPCAC_17991 [Pristionchus entomophagus]|uniref:Uncharacterized protein n=1 Tax=Pristionchus entomophagus TaxID=358040 RepID=A0AAV5TNA7_9BILA|nr:hypothetical protein PENTCL1PPCAC_17991 [Pristionchus entomophagus]
MGMVSPEMVLPSSSSFLRVDTLSPPLSAPLSSLSPSSNGPLPSGHDKTSLDLSRPSKWLKRGSMPAVTAIGTRNGGEDNGHRRISIARVEKAVESFRDRRSKSSSEKPSKGEKIPFTCGFASLTNNNDEENEGGCWSEPVNSAMKEDKCEQLVAKSAEDYLEGLTEKQRNILRKRIGNGERKEEEYFMWLRKGPGTKMAILSVKCVENHLAGGGGRRVKWRNVSTGRISIYRYSIAVLPVGLGTRMARSIRQHRKLCLILVWLSFVALICLTVVLGSIGNDVSPSEGTTPQNPTARIG